MKSVRMFLKKKGRLKFVSHLDMYRFMTRALRKTEIPAWYTEGFNKHLYLNFALPLTLGYESDYEIMDIKITDDDFPLSEITAQLNSVTPEFLEVFSAAEPKLKCSEIAYASFSARFPNTDLSKELASLLSAEKIICHKKNKRGEIVEIDIAGKILNAKIENNQDTHFAFTLPAGNGENINPALLLEAFYNSLGEKPYCEITRTAVLDKDFNLFE